MAGAPTAVAEVSFPGSPVGMRARSTPTQNLSSPSGVPPLAPAAAAASVVGSADARTAIRQYFPVQEWARAEAVGTCESGLRSVLSPPNRNGSIDRGVFQLNDGGTLQELLVQDGLPVTRLDMALDVDWNVRAAARLWSQRGWQPWTCAAKLGYV